MKHTAIVPPVLLTSCLLLGAAVADVSAQASNWPAFRGTNTAGVSSTAVPTSWDLASSRNVGLEDADSRPRAFEPDRLG